MDFELSEELIAVRDVAREFAEKEIAPSAAKDDKEKNFRADLIKKMGELGFYGTMIPESYGGNGLGFLAMVLVTEEIARAHSAMRVGDQHADRSRGDVLQFGTEEQKKKFIPGLVSGETIGCFAITESDAGSDVAAHAHDGDEGRRSLFAQRRQAVDLQRPGDQRRAGLCLHRQDAEASRHERVLCRLESTRLDPQDAGNHGRALLAAGRTDLREFSASPRRIVSATKATDSRSACGSSIKPGSIAPPAHWEWRARPKKRR